MRRRFRLPLPLLAVLLCAGCGGAAPGNAPAPDDDVGPALVLDRFLRAVNANDLPVLTTLFGTSDKTILELESREQAETRMFVIASALRHDDYVIEGRQVVPGRLRNATQLMVRMRLGQRQVVVPFLLVRTTAGGWRIEQVDLQKALGGT